VLGHDAGISFEAPGQIEVRTAPAGSVRELAPMIAAAGAGARAHVEAEGLLALAVGFHPFASWMDDGDGGTPQARSSEQLVIELAAAVHVSVSYRDERDAQQKVAAARALTPFLVALYGGSPLARGEVVGASVRAALWTSAFPSLRLRDDVTAGPDGFFERYAAWLASRPTDEAPRHDDWREQVRVPTGDVRLKDVVELRCFDSIPIPAAIAAAAMVRGLLCDPTNLERAARLEAAVPRRRAIELAARHGLADPALAARAAELVGEAAAGLRRLGDDPGALDWATAALAARRNHGQAIAARWAGQGGARRSFLRELAS
jgi:glutamate--cysteine ligase